MAWSRDGTPIASMDLSGCKVEALDSSIGSMDEVSNELEARLAPCRA